jgi:hypothetical protein
MPPGSLAATAAVLLSGLLVPGPALGQSSDRTPGTVSNVSEPESALQMLAASELAPPSIQTSAPIAAVGATQAPPPCAGCPSRSRLRPILESLALDVMYNGINHARGHHTARVGFNSWWANLKHGFEWDVNPWLVNQIGHPYQGSNYFTSGRAHGLSFWEAGAVAAFGSATWEFFAENNRASLNDLVNTTLGGITLGEVMHRTAWLVRDPALSGGARRRRELIAAGIDPMSGLVRALSGYISRPGVRPAGLVPSEVAVRAASGVLWQGQSFRTLRAATRPFVDVDLVYGDVRSGASRVPFNDFTVQVSAGGGSAVSQAGVRGRLFAQPLEHGRVQLTIFQTYDYIVNRAYSFGGQGFELEAALRHAVSARTTWWLAAIGGATVLAAVDQPFDVTDPLDPALLTRRAYDYGPGMRFGGMVQLLRDDTERLTIVYRGYQISVVDGARSNHVLQRLDVGARLPLTQTMALGAAGEYFFRKAYFWQAGARTDESPQARLFLAWRTR